MLICLIHFYAATYTTFRKWYLLTTTFISVYLKISQQEISTILHQQNHMPERLFIAG